MRYFQTVKEALFEVERDLVEMGIDNWPKSMQNKKVENVEDYKTKELIGYGFRVHDADPKESVVATALFYKVSESIVETYCRDEIMDRVGLAAVNPGRSWLAREETWKPFLNQDGKFDYTYSERMNGLLWHLVETLKRDMGTRQAVVSIWDPTDLWHTGGRKRIPCSIYYQFLVRKDKLHLIYTMRSCDIYTHFGYDVTLAIWLGQKVAQTLGINELIDFTMFIGSLHAYKKDYEPRGVF